VTKLEKKMNGKTEEMEEGKGRKEGRKRRG
jgi:hypothetical protein